MTFSIIKRIKSFTYAFSGVWILLKTQHNSWIHLFATVCVIFFGFYFAIGTMEWIAIILAIASVWVAELLNTAVEFLADTITLEQHPKIKKAKDTAAGGVLIAAIGAAVVGVIVFLPYIL